MSEKKDDSIGYAIVITLLISGIFLLIDNQYLGHVYINNTVSLVFLFIGIIGLGLELDQVDTKGWSYFGIGVSFLMVWSVIYIKFYNIFLNWIMLLVLIFSGVFIFNGLINAMKITNFKTMAFSKILKMVIVLGAQIATAIVALLQIKQLI